MKGIQYDLTSGIITGSCSPAINTDQQPMPEGRGQLVVAPEIDYTGMKVDITQNSPLLIPA